MIKIEFGFGVQFDREGHGINRDEHYSAIRKIETEAARIFGSYTLQEAHGGWTNSQGKLVKEDGYTLFTVQNQPAAMFQDRLDAKITELANFIKLALNQEAVAITSYPVNFKLI